MSIVNTTLSASDAGVKVVDPAGPLLEISRVFDSLTSYEVANNLLDVETTRVPELETNAVLPSTPSQLKSFTTSYPQSGVCV